MVDKLILDIKTDHGEIMAQVRDKVASATMLVDAIYDYSRVKNNSTELKLKSRYAAWKK